MDMRGADLALLVSLDTLLAERNVTRAAARLHLSQPALSAQLARLRELFGDPLLVPARRGRGMVPTTRALALQAPLNEALHALGRAVSAPLSFDPASATRTFTVAGNDNVVAMMMLDVVARAEKAGYAGLRFALRMPQHELLLAQMERGELDLFLGGSSYAPAGARVEVALPVRFRMAQRKGHPRGPHAPGLAQYCALRHVIVSTDGSFDGFMDQLLAQRGCRRTVAVSVAQYHLVPPLLAASDLVCTLPSRFLERYADSLDCFDLPLDVPALDLSLAWHRRSDNDPALRWLRGQITASLQQASASW